MAATAKHPRKTIQSRHTATDQQHAAERPAYAALGALVLRKQEELYSQMSLKDLLQQLHAAVEDLAALDTSLTALFDGAPNTDVTEHQQLVQFRSRVARRISRYGQLTKGLAQLVERVIACNPSQSQEGGHQKDAFSPRQLRELDALLKQHQQRLQKYKSQFAAWWQSTERHFHTMRMANYVCSVQERAQTTGVLGAREGAAGLPPRSTGPRVDPVRAQATSGEQLPSVKPSHASQDDAAALRKLAQPQQQSQQLLHETRQVMVQEVQRMQVTQDQLQQSSGVLEQTEATYNVFGARLSSATGMLQALKKRSATDSELIWLAFLFFLGCCAFVVLRRAGLLKFLIGRLVEGLSWAWESCAWNESPEPIVGISSAFENAGAPAVRSVSVAAPAASKLFAASATIAVSGTPSQTHKGIEAERGVKTSLVTGEDGSRLTADEVEISPKVQIIRKEPNGDDGVGAAEAPGDGMSATLGDVDAMGQISGDPQASGKMQRIVDMESSAASSGDMGRPRTPQKLYAISSPRGSINRASVTARLQ